MHAHSSAATTPTTTTTATTTINNNNCNNNSSNNLEASKAAKCQVEFASSIKEMTQELGPLVKKLNKETKRILDQHKVRMEDE